MHKPLLFARPSLNALARALATMPAPPMPARDINTFETPEGYPFTLIPVKTREGGE